MSRRLTKIELETAVAECVAAGNPYIKKSIQFFIDMKPRYLFNGSVFTAEEMDELYASTCRHDVKAGYSDRLYGYYDKWYRYSRDDEGRAYDKGTRIAVMKDDCVEEMVIIPCIN